MLKVYAQYLGRVTHYSDAVFAAARDEAERLGRTRRALLLTTTFNENA